MHFSFLVKRQVSSPVCDDADSLACTLLFTVNTHMCSDDCIANKICPRLCGKCSKYFHNMCRHVNLPLIRQDNFHE